MAAPVTDPAAPRSDAASIALAAPTAGAHASTARRRWLGLGVIALAQLMVILDATIVNIALPSAQAALRFSTGNRQWVVTSYALAFGSLLLLGGRMSDTYGRRNVFLTGIAGFATASAVGGCAQNLATLIAARVGQGVFGALLAPAALSLLVTTFTDPRERAKAFGIFGAVAGAGGAIGLLLGGALTSYASWRWCLLVNVPIAAMAFAGALLLLDKQTVRRSLPLDLPGSVTAVLGLSALVYGLGRSETVGFSDPVSLTSIVAGVALLVLFVVVELRSAAPLMPLRIPLDRMRGGAYLGVLLLCIGVFGMFLFLSYFLQQSLGYSPVRAGVAFMPLSVVLIAAAQVSILVVLPRVGPRPLIPAGLLLVGAGLGLFGLFNAQTSYLTGVVPGLVLAGMGFGMVMPVAIQSATSSVQPSDSGIASALVNTAQQIGGAIGVALLSAISGHAASNYAANHAGDGLSAAQLGAGAALASYTSAFRLSAAICVVAAVIVVAVLPGGRLTHHGATAAPAAAQ